MMKFMFNRSWWLLAILIVVAAIGLRLIQLGSVPSGIYWDEVAMLVDAKSVATSGSDMHGRPWYQVMYPSYGDYKLPIYIWLATLCTQFFGVSAWALRLPSLVAGVLTVVVAGIGTYLGLTSSASRQNHVAWGSALASMAVVAFSPWSLMFSRTAFEGHVGQVMLAISILCLILSQRWSWLRYLSPIVGALATYAYFSVRFVWPVVFLAASWMLAETKHQDSKTVKRFNWLKSGLKIGSQIVLPLGIFGLFLIPMLTSPLYGDSNRFRLGTDSVLKNEDEIIQSNVYRELAGNTPLDRVIFHRWWLTGRELLLNYSDNLSFRFLFTQGDPNLRHGTGHFGLFVWPLLPFFILGWWYLARYRLRWAVVLFIWWISAVLPASVPENTPHALRSLNALVPLSIVIGTGIGAVTEAWWRRRLPIKASLAVQFSWAIMTIGLLGVFVATLFVTASFILYYFKAYPLASAEAWQHGYPEVAQEIIKLREGHPVYIESFDDKFYLWVMAFGPYEGNEYQTWTSFSYQFRSFDGIYFSRFPGWQNVLNGDTRVVVAGRVAEVDEVISLHRGRVVREQLINDPAQQPIFKVILMDKLP